MARTWGSAFTDYRYEALGLPRNTALAQNWACVGRSGPGQPGANVDETDAPFHRQRGGAPALSEQDIRDVIAFLSTLTDGAASKH